MSSEFVLNELARWMFGLSASFHFLFVPLSIGLLLCVNLLQTAFVMSRRPTLARAASFWSYFFLLAWVTGVATGYPLRTQLATHWEGYLLEARPVFEAIFQIEGALLWPMVALVLANTVLRRWVPPVALMVLGWLLLLVMSVQSLTILSINAWMQVPGMLNFGRQGWRVDSLWPLLTHPTTLQKTWHTLSAALLCGAFFVFALSAALMREGRDRSVARVSVGMAAWVALLGALSVMLSGHESASGIAQRQPLKFAAFEGHWRADDEPAPLVLWAAPDEGTGSNAQEVSIPFMLSLLRDGSLQSPPGVLDLADHWSTRYLALVAADQASRQQGALAPVAKAAAVDLSATLGLERLSLVAARQQGASWRTMDPQGQALAVAQAAMPPVTAVFYFFRAMVFCGVACCLLGVLAFWLRKPLRDGEMPGLMRVLAWASPLPWIGTLSGWAVCELGRQPWTIYGMLPTALAGQVSSTSNGVLALLQLFAAGALISLLFAWAVRSVFQAGPTSEQLPGLGLARHLAQRLAQKLLWALTPAAQRGRQLAPPAQGLAQPPAAGNTGRTTQAAASMPR